jgi:tetratricopeptide (TPR) repeat protein
LSAKPQEAAMLQDGFAFALCQLARQMNPHRADMKILVNEVKAEPAWQPLANRLRLKIEECLLAEEAHVLSSDLDVVLARTRMERSALFDEKSCVALGQFAGADALLMGELWVTPQSCELSLRLIEMKSGRLLKQTSGKLPAASLLPKIPEEAKTYQNGRLFSDRREYARAIDAFNQAIEEEGKFAIYFFQRGLCYSRLGQLSAALSDYDNAIACDGRQAFFFNYRGILYQKMGDKEAARRDYDSAIRLHPQYGYAYSNLGNLYLDLRQYAKALEHHRKAAELVAHDGQILYNLACSYARNQQVEKALATLQEAIRYGADRAAARQDEDLQSLRAAPEFQKLLEER